LRKDIAIIFLDIEEHEKIIKITRGLAVYLLSGAAAFCLEVVVFTDRGWELPISWWYTNFLPLALWLVAPFFYMSYLILKKKNNLRQYILLLLSSIGQNVFTILLFLDAFFVHKDPRSWIIYILVPVYLWIAIAITASLRYAIREIPDN
jgi:hypothetical protein